MPPVPVAESGCIGSEEAFAYCRGIVRDHPENFPVGSRLAPRRLRPYVHAIYAFARAADDFADEACHEGARLEKLDEWEERLDRCLQGEADHPVFVALGETIRRFEIPHRLLRDLLDAFRQDCRVRRYARWDELLDYSRRSANPVGRMVLLVHGYRDERRGRYSDSICTALQLTNFWQDVSVDLEKDRIYLPGEDRVRHGVSDADLFAGGNHPGVRKLVLELVARTRGLYREGRPLLGSVRGRLGLELRAVWLGGTRILDKIEESEGDVFGKRPVLRAADRGVLALRALAGSWAC